MYPEREVGIHNLQVLTEGMTLPEQSRFGVHRLQKSDGKRLEEFAHECVIPFTAIQNRDFGIIKGSPPYIASAWRVSHSFFDILEPTADDIVWFALSNPQAEDEIARRRTQETWAQTDHWTKKELHTQLVSGLVRIYYTSEWVLQPWMPEHEAKGFVRNEGIPIHFPTKGQKPTQMS